MAREELGEDPIDRRLARIEGQIAGVRKMARERRDCVDILTQLAAIRAALDKVGIEFLAHHMRDCAQGDGCRDERGLSETERIDEMRTAVERLLK